MTEKKNGKWYSSGLHFECSGCGGCCAGPAEGYIWITRPEIERAAKFLGLPESQFRKKFLKRVGLRTSLLEHKVTKDCIFLTDFGNGRRGCAIYAARPNQCRTWPFWKENLRTPDDWNLAAMKCPGINRGPMFGPEQIQERLNQKQWWDDGKG